MPKEIPNRRIELKLETLKASLKKNMGVDLDAAFSDDVYVCKNCGHEYVGERLCPECGA